MISFSKAAEMLRELALVRRAGLRAEMVALPECAGRIASAAVLCPEPLPLFDNSSMDGFAFPSRLAQAPAEFRVAGTLAAGDPPPENPAHDSVWEIMTGAPIPANCDGVIRVEDAQPRKDGARTVGVLTKVAAREGQFVRRAGSDFDRGEMILPAGTRLEPSHVLALASAGVARVGVMPRLRVAILGTGQELVRYDQTPPPGSIRNSTGPYLVSAMTQLGFEVVSAEMVGDEPRDFAAAARRLLGARPDVFVTTGAVSMGKFDFVPGELAELGARTLFHKVAIQPGKPLLVAEIPGGPAIFGIPGNPISSVVALRFFLEPYARALLGQAPERPVRAKLAAAVRKPPGLRQLAKANFEVREGEAIVTVAQGQESYRMRPLTSANAWAILPEEGGELPRGSFVDVVPLFSGGFRDV